MLKYLLVDDGKYKHAVSGHTMLHLADQATYEFASANQVKLTNTGTVTNPVWTLGSAPQDWTAVATEIRKYAGVWCAMQICGRWVYKNPGGYYMRDDGGVDGGRAWDQPYVRRTDSQGDFAKGSGDFERGGPSYGQYMKRMQDQQEHSSKHVKAVGVGRNQHQVSDNAAWSKAKAEKLRRVLKADLSYANKLKLKGDLTTGQLLPVLAATMFLAEPARNLRGFLVNLFLLDMIENGYAYADTPQGNPIAYTWDVVMWNPQYDHTKGGLLPAAGTGSASSAKINPMLDYTQEKELDVLLRYFTFNDFKGVAAMPPNAQGFKPVHETGPVAIDKDRDLSNSKKILGYLKYLMSYRLAIGFDYR